ncbi:MULTISPECIES: quinone oxidoreductase family protein [unclassified Halomonas]|uniref:quinone oxidoreductase family protein n=1 Tax=unclassified Halomonas TaxID=2609666 RepID=UPI001CF39F41|nr:MULTISPECIES: zinc-binding alcohol dehydrogenase family protein [unclassified Halomonas]MCA8863307.1 zinc-binding alcohol dehydrogenase family protein [Halomonas sp. SBBP1]UZH08627.1 zinc-binding alcohol dehydrogenase family protein [Halomonas sp. BDJS001]
MHSLAAQWIVGLLRERNIPFQICGGLAAKGYGAERALNDIDLFVPDEHFMTVVQAGQAHISKPAAHYCEEGWDLTYVQFKYKDIKVEVGNAEGAHILDAASQTWVPLHIAFDRYETVNLLGLALPLMLKEDLIRYKSMLSRPVDIDDVRAIKSEIKMQASVYDKCGDPTVLRYADVPDPELGAFDVLIEVQAISIEGGDLINRQMTPPPQVDYIVGYAAAGVVVALGSAVRTRKVGDRVTSFGLDGSHATLRAIPESQTWLVPDGVDIAEAAVLPISFGTAHHCLFARGALQSGETVLIQAGAGGVGIAAIQLAKRIGATVITVSSGSERLAKLKSLGADHVVDHQSEDVVKAVFEYTQGRGVDLAVDPVGSTLQTSLQSLAPEGRLVFVGNAGGGELTVDLWPALQANHSLFGVFMGTQFGYPNVAATVDRMLDDVANAKLKVLIDRRFPLENAADAHEYAERGKPFGRVVMHP